MSRIFCIGDIHGCSNTLDDLLVNIIKLKKTDHLVFVGDYIDRGPDSKGVIDIILNLEKKEYKTTCLLGNHEELFMESDLDDDIFIHWFKDCGGFDTLKSFNVPTYENLEEKYKYVLSDDMYGYFSSSAVFTFGPKLTKLPIVPSSVIVAS